MGVTLFSRMMIHIIYCTINIGDGNRKVYLRWYYVYRSKVLHGDSWALGDKAAMV